MIDTIELCEFDKKLIDNYWHKSFDVSLNVYKYKINIYYII